MLFRLLLREVQRVAADHSLILTLLLAPLVYVFFYGSIYQYKAEEEVPIAVVDEDRSGLSQTLITQIDNSQMVNVALRTTLEGAKESMYHGHIQGFLYIEKGMEQKVLSLRQANMVLAVNAARFLPSSEVAGAITQIGLTVGAGVRLQYLQKKGMNTEMSMQEVMPVNVDYRPMFNSRSDYGTFLLPGLIAMILQQTLLIGLAGGSAAERQRGSLAEWMQTAGGNASTALWGKGLFYFLLFCAYAYFFLTVNFRVLELQILGIGWELALITVIFLLSLIPMGIFTGLLFKSQLLATQLMVFSTYPIFLITGYSWPLSEMPPFVKAVSYLLPITPFLGLYQGIVQQGAHITDRLPDLYHLMALWCFYTAICLWKMRRLEKQNTPVHAV
ncbi:ABC transporter permease [Chitinophaga pollutisoli]|uniref:ABC transporter permease n=1 Tax=Chitinophaga pollutisoli TaxID=3133966 RepID=A0ABZ2YMH8_9BACT